MKEQKLKINEIFHFFEEILQKLRDEINKGISDWNNIKDKNELINIIGTKIKNSIKPNDIKILNETYHDLNPKNQELIKERVQQLEILLNEETYLKTQIRKSEPEDKNIKKIDPNKIRDSIELLKLKNNLNKIKTEISTIIKNDHKDDNLNPVQLENKNLKDFNNYSFKCLTQNLNFTMYKGTNEAIFQIKLENDGEFPWPKNKTILSTDESKSDIKMQNIHMEPLNPHCQSTLDIKFSNMSKYPEGKYYSYLNFTADGKKFGDILLISVEIIDSNKGYYYPIVNEARKENSLSKDVASDGTIIYNMFYNKN